MAEQPTTTTLTTPGPVEELIAEMEATLDQLKATVDQLKALRDAEAAK